MPEAQYYIYNLFVIDGYFGGLKMKINNKVELLKFESKSDKTIYFNEWRKYSNKDYSLKLENITLGYQDAERSFRDIRCHAILTSKSGCIEFNISGIE